MGGVDETFGRTREILEDQTAELIWNDVARGVADPTWDAAWDAIFMFFRVQAISGATDIVSDDMTGAALREIGA